MSYAKRTGPLRPSSSNSSLESSGSCSSSSSSGGHLCNKFATHNGLVKCVCLGQTTGEVFASVSNDEQIKLWSITNTECLMTLKPKSSTETVQFSGNEEVLASGSIRGVVRLWDLNTKNAFRTFKAHDQTIKHVDFYQAGSFISTGSSDRTVKLWDMKQPTPVHKYEGHLRGIVVQKFSTHGMWIASGDSSGVIKIWDMAACKMLAELRGHSASILDIQFHPKVMLMASSGADGSVCFWELERFSLLGSTGPTLLNSNAKSTNTNNNACNNLSTAPSNTMMNATDFGPVNRIQFHPNGHQLIACGRDKYLLYYFDDRVELQSLSEQQFGLARDLAINKDGLVVASYFSNCISLHQIKWQDLSETPHVERQRSADSNVSLRSFDQEQIQKTFSQMESLSSRNSGDLTSGFDPDEEFLKEINFDENSPIDENKIFCPQRELNRTPSSEDQQLMDENKLNHTFTLHPTKNFLSECDPSVQRPIDSDLELGLNRPIKRPNEFILPRELQAFRNANSRNRGPVSKSVSLRNLSSIVINSPKCSNRVHPQTDLFKQQTSAPATATLLTPLPVGNKTSINGPRSVLRPTELNGISLNESPPYIMPSPQAAKEYPHPLPVRRPAKSRHQQPHFFTPQANRNNYLCKSTAQLISAVNDSEEWPISNEKGFVHPMSAFTHRHQTIAASTTALNQPQSFSTSIDNLPQLPALYTNGHNSSAFRPYYVAPPQQNYSKADSITIRPNLKTLTQNSLNRELMSTSMGNLNAPVVTGKIDSERTLLMSTISSEEEVITDLFQGHLDAQLMLAERESNFKLCLKAHQGDPVRAFQIASSTQDMILMADLLRFTLAKPVHWTVQLCQKVLPYVDSLLRTTQEVCVNAASSAIQFVMQNLLPIILQNISEHPSIGVDVEREERHQKAMDCYNQLLTIKSFVLKQQCMTGETGSHFRQLATHLEKLDRK